jgi:hypothetical protein
MPVAGRHRDQGGEEDEQLAQMRGEEDREC